MTRKRRTVTPEEVKWAQDGLYDLGEKITNAFAALAVILIGVIISYLIYLGGNYQ